MKEFLVLAILVLSILWHIYFKEAFDKGLIGILGRIILFLIYAMIVLYYFFFW